jgi:hypothetical protein
MEAHKRCIKKINRNKNTRQMTVTVPKDWPYDDDYVELFPVPENKALKEIREQKENERTRE